MERKEFAAEVKELTDKGEGILRFITFDTIDKDGDVTLPGFIGSQDAPLLPGHQWTHIPLGRGKSYEQKDGTYFKFALNLELQAAKDWYSHLKFDQSFGAGRSLQQISYGFSIHPDGQSRGQKNGQSVRFLQPRPDGQPGAKLHEASFVLVGAGVDTGVVSVKDAEPEPTIDEPPILASATTRGIGAHQTPTSPAAWDASVHQRLIKALATPGYYRRMYAWQDPSGDATHKVAFAFPHHFVSADGEPGAASIRACANGIALLNGARGGLVIPAAEGQAIYTHLAAHLKDAGREPPELRHAHDSTYPLDATIELALWDLETILHRIDAIRDIRGRKGRALTEERLAQLQQMQERFVTLCAMVKMKALDRPSDLVMEDLSAEARADALGRRIAAIRGKVTKEAEDSEAREIATRVQRWEQRIRA